MSENIQIHRFKNGVRLAHLHTDSKVAHCGIFIDSGARDEPLEDWGVAHFTEHMMFKGTTKRRAHHIINRLESVGGELNAYTTKEETCIHAVFLAEYYDRALELFSDVLQNSVFPSHEIIKEKDIIVDEINSYKDNPAELIFDEFEELIFGTNTLGRNILGDYDSIKKIKGENINSFVKNTYLPEKIVVSSVGDIPFNKLCKRVEKYFGQWETEEKHIRSTLDIKNDIIRKVNTRNTYQAHCIIGSFAYNIRDKKRLPLSLLTNLLGGSAMNSKLNMALREKYGYAYHTEANYSPYSDTGLFTIYFGTDHNNFNQCVNIVNRELKILCTKKIEPIPLTKIKKQLIGQTMINASGDEAQMFSIGKSMLAYNKVDTLEQIYRKIDRISSSEILETANEVLHPNKLSMLKYE